MYLKSNLKFNRMRIPTTHRLLECFEEAVREGTYTARETLSSAYHEFMDHLLSSAADGRPVIEKLRHLRHLELELDMFLDMAKDMADKHVRIHIAKASALVRTEIELLRLAVEHPGWQGHAPVRQEGQAKLPALHWKGSAVNLMELIASLDYAGLVANGEGGRQSFAALVSAFEAFFHVSLPKPYDLRADLARRKKSLSVLLPKLKEAYEKNIVNCGIGLR